MGRILLGKDESFKNNVKRNLIEFILVTLKRLIKLAKEIKKHRCSIPKNLTNLSHIRSKLEFILLENNLNFRRMTIGIIEYGMCCTKQKYFNNTFISVKKNEKK